jgi:hypothetical protein
MLHQQNLAKYGQKRSNSCTKHSEKEKECQFNFSLCSEISQKLTQKACFLTLKLYIKCQKHIRHFLSLAKGHEEIKKRAFDNLKQLLYTKKQEGEIEKYAFEYMQFKRTQLWFKAWRYFRDFERLEKEFEHRQQSVVEEIGEMEVERDRWNERILGMFEKKLKFNVLIEWSRRTQVDKSIKSKVVKMLQKKETKFGSLDKWSIEQIFDKAKQERLQKYNECLGDVKNERRQIVQTIRETESIYDKNVRDLEIEKHILKAKIFSKIKTRRFDNSSFRSARKALCLTPEKIQKPSSPTILAQPISSLHGTPTSKHRIHLSLHSYLSTSFSNSHHNNTPTRTLWRPLQHTSLPRPLFHKSLTPRNAPNDLFRKLESKVKKKKVEELPFLMQSWEEKDPTEKISQHLDSLVTSMRKLRDVPDAYFRKSYFYSHPEMGKINSIEDMLREGRRVNPYMSVANLFQHIKGYEIANRWFNIWKIAFIQNWICKDVLLLKKYKRGKNILSSIRGYIKQKKNNIEEFKLKNELLYKARILKSMKESISQPVTSFIKRKFFLKWKSNHKNLVISKQKHLESIHFHTHLLKQKSLFILYKYSQCHRIPKKSHERSLKTRAFFSLLLFHQKCSSLKPILLLHNSQEKLLARQTIAMKECLQKWRKIIEKERLRETEEKVGHEYSMKMAKKCLRRWRVMRKMGKVGELVEKKVNSVMVGFPFFWLKNYAKGLEENSLMMGYFENQNLELEYRTEKLKSRVIRIFQIKRIFSAWKEVAIVKRIDFPYSFYNQRLAEKAFKVLILLLRNKWIRQRQSILIETYRQTVEERQKGKIFAILCSNMLQRKKRKYMTIVIEDFRKEILLTKSFKALKESFLNRYKSKNIINYWTENMHTYETHNTQPHVSPQTQMLYNNTTSMFNSPSSTPPKVPTTYIPVNSF